MSFRIAPTPSGLLHVGNAYNFILTAILARHAMAPLRLRIDDSDAVRARPEYLEDIFETLRWLGLQWDEGPRDAAEHAARFSQTLRTGVYNETLSALIAKGVVFACYCSRKEIIAAAPDGQYPGTCRDKGFSLDTPDTALRLRTPQDEKLHFIDAVLGKQALALYDIARDPVIRRRDGLPAYHIASFTDDVDFGITHIVRGTDLLRSTTVQRFIALTLGAERFDGITFYHHPLVADPAGGKLSKSAGSASLRAMRERGVSIETIYVGFSEWMGWPHAAASLTQAVDLFSQYGLDSLRSLALCASTK
jgi:glutamyl/glutaminyl-tRNA synthetase